MTRPLLTLAVLAALTGPAFGQGTLAPIGVQLHDTNGDPCNACVLFSFAAGTSTPLATFADEALGSSNGTSVTMNAAGYATVFLDSRLSYKLTLRTSAGVDIWTRDGIKGQLSGVVSVTAASTRGIQVSRPSADAGISIASTGGSGKTYGLVSNTSGVFRIQDDSDGTPRFELSGNNGSFVGTGTFTVDGALLAANTFGTHSLSASGSGAMVLGVRNTSSNAAAYAQVQIGNDGAADTMVLRHTSSAFTPTGAYVADAAHLVGTRAGGVRIATTHANGDVVIATGTSPTTRVSVLDTGAVGIGTTPTHDLHLRSTGDDLSAGLKIDRADGSYLIANVNDGASGVLQAATGVGWLPLELSTSGGGVKIGGGTAILKVVTATATWNPGSIADGASTSASLSMAGTGATSASPCFVGFPVVEGGVTVGGIQLTGYVSVDPDFATVNLFNKSGGNFNADSATLRLVCFVY